MELFRASDIVYAGDSASPRRDMLSVLWAITKVCNFSCSYCVYYKSAANAEFSSKEDLIKAARTLIRLGRPGYQITLYGGEPSHHPHFMDLFDYLVASGAPISLRMFTNASRSGGFFERMVPKARDVQFGFIFSLHPEYANIDKFARHLEVCAGGGCSVAVGVMYTPHLRDRTRSYIDRLYEVRTRVPFFMGINFPYTREGVLGDGRNEDDIAWIEQARAAFDKLPPPPSHFMSPLYTRVLSDLVVDRGDGRRERLPLEESLQLLELSRQETPSYKDFHCCSGANVLFIEEDGAIRGGVCSASASMGNIFRDDEVRLSQAMRVVKCSSVACASIENIPLPKFRDKAEAEACMAEFQQRSKRYLYAAETNRLNGVQAADSKG